jgi:hypothetical protein
MYVCVGLHNYRYFRNLKYKNLSVNISWVETPCIFILKMVVISLSETLVTIDLRFTS